jgi:hypothetical protein
VRQPAAGAHRVDFHPCRGRAREQADPGQRHDAEDSDQASQQVDWPPDAACRVIHHDQLMRLGGINPRSLARLAVWVRSRPQRRHFVIVSPTTRADEPRAAAAGRVRWRGARASWSSPSRRECRCDPSWLPG